MAGPLAGVKVLDLTTVFMGPLATMAMADIGADIIKVESLDGDMMRYIGPHKHRDMSALYLGLNSNKRSIALDLKHPEGRAALLKLVETADVLLYNIRPASMARLDLGYAAVRAANSKIIYCGCYGFGEEGPYAGKPAYDDLIQGASGVGWLTGQMMGKPGYSAFALADHLTGMSVVYCVIAALYHRARTGEGQSIEVPMFESMTRAIMSHHLWGRQFEPPLSGPGYPRQLASNRKPYSTKDGYLCTVIITDLHWSRFFTMAGCPEHIADPRFKDTSSRADNVEALYQLLEDILASRTLAEWMPLFEKNDIPALPMKSLDDLLDDPHLNAVGLFDRRVHPTEGPLVSLHEPTNWSASKPDRNRRHAPNLGEHTAEVLREAGMPQGEIDALLARGAAAQK
ncbi:MAG: CoA transferase [Betaproteobacteria bacterium]|nr:CoA transferase [Betaproteobacteria bacterium]